jgi:alpha-L-fucosidase
MENPTQLIPRRAGCVLGAIAATLTTLNAAAAVKPPVSYGAVPTPAQVKQAERAFYAFCHFTVDTFTGAEWGSGTEKPEIFNPRQFDANQIVSSLKASGAKGVILTCKHHDGFCLWPTKTTGHNISASPYKNGKGDIVREFADACKKLDFDFGVYVSPWDRNNEHYGTPKYVTDVYREQIRELTTQYGKLFEIWFDGANGGSGYYGGKGGSRSIDRKTYYDWPGTWEMVKKNQPEIIIFSDIGPGVRWCGNEHGKSADPCRATINLEATDGVGSIDSGKLGTGHLGGSHWIPAEVDVSIRGGWFFHENQNPRSPGNLMQIYLDSVGHGATFNLNVPPDKRGLLHENDVESLKQFGEHLKQTFAENLAAGARCTTKDTRGNDPAYGPERMLDDDIWSAWVSDDAVTTPEVVMELKGEKTFNLIHMREDIRLGLRLEGVAVDAMVNGQWKELAKAESVGSCHLWRIPSVVTNRVRIRVTRSPVCPALSDFGLFLEPEFPVWVQPIGGDPALAKKAGWKIVSCSYEAGTGKASNAIDGNPSTIWHTHGDEAEHTLPQEIVVNLGKARNLKGFTYLPRQDNTSNGMVDEYAFLVSTDGKQWQQVAAGEFGNLRANPVEQSVPFPAVKAHYFKFIAKHALDKNHAVVAEIGVVEQE